MVRCIVEIRDAKHVERHSSETLEDHRYDERSQIHTSIVEFVTRTPVQRCQKHLDLKYSIIPGVYAGIILLPGHLPGVATPVRTCAANGLTGLQSMKKPTRVFLNRCG